MVHNTHIDEEQELAGHGQKVGVKSAEAQTLPGSDRDMFMEDLEECMQ